VLFRSLFPRDEEEGDELEEQRRLFYVAITRAKDELHLTSCHWRRLHGRLYETAPSRFLSEIEGELIRPMTAKRAAGPGASAGYARARPYGGADGYAQPGSAGALGRPSLPGQPKKEDNPWRAGLAVYHDDFGSGVIIKVSPTPSSGPLVVVRFESGRQAQFFPKFTKKLEVTKG
jgi:DNA helicase II / ATP-dependent DNA helicase PcrA